MRMDGSMRQHAALAKENDFGLLAPLYNEHRHMVFHIVIWSPRQKARSQQIGLPISHSLASPYRDYQGTAEVVMCHGTPLRGAMTA